MNLLGVDDGDDVGLMLMKGIMKYGYWNGRWSAGFILFWKVSATLALKESRQGLDLLVGGVGSSGWWCWIFWLVVLDLLVGGVWIFWLVELDLLVGGVWILWLVELDLLVGGVGSSSWWCLDLLVGGVGSSGWWCLDLMVGGVGSSGWWSWIF